MERLQKILARSGLASRREAEQWIREGRVTVNGAVVRTLGTKADSVRDKIKVNGRLIPQPSPLRYFVFHKPVGLLTSMRDPQGRAHLGDWLEPSRKHGRLFPVGRLDTNSSGLLLLTNDGGLAQRLSHPRYGIRRGYQVKVGGCPSEAELDRLRKGIRLEDGMATPTLVRVLKLHKKKAWLAIELQEGRYREVRRMFKALGYSVEKLVRTRFGSIGIGSLAPGEMRPLFPKEIAALKKAVGIERVPEESRS
jgi:23S rRNA pseudouridine2605 synthase